MPHVVVEYSGNLDGVVDAQGLVDDVHAAVVASGIAETAAIRTRAARRDIFRIANGDPRNAFVHVVIRLRAGRPKEQLTAVGQALLAAVEQRLATAFAAHPTAISVEIHEIDHLTFRRNTIRERAASDVL